MKYKYVFLTGNADYYKYIYNITNNGYFHNNKMNRFKRFLFRLHNSCITNKLFNLPLRSIWKKHILDEYVLKTISYKDKVCFVFSCFGDYPVRTGLMDYIKKHYVNCKIVFDFKDKVSVYQKNCKNFFDLYKPFVDLFMSYNLTDCIKYKLTHKRPMVINYKSFKNDNPENDVFFIGKNKGRLPVLHNIYTFLSDNGIKCDFYITDVGRKFKLKKSNIVYNKRLKYSEVIKHTCNSKCILNIVQEGANGITLRDYEAIGMNKILLTNNNSITNSKFNTDSKIVLLDNLGDIVNKLNEYKADEVWNGSDEYSFDNYYLWLEELLD